MNTSKPKWLTLPSEWPVALLALPAFVAIWGGWVGLGELTGFGPVNLLPGIGDGWTINSAITLPIGVEAYAAYALRVWLSQNTTRTDQARRFAKWSAIGSLVLGALGQVAYHLMTAWGIKTAPWGVTTFVSCLPVIVLGCGAALAHLSNATPADTSQDAVAEPPAAPSRTSVVPARPVPSGGQEPAVPVTSPTPETVTGTAPQEASPSPLGEASPEPPGLRLVPSQRLLPDPKTTSRKASPKTPRKTSDEGSCTDEDVFAEIASYASREGRLPTANWLKTNLPKLGHKRAGDLLAEYQNKKQEALA